MTEPSTSHVEQQIAARIQAQRVKVQAAKEQRAELSAARRRGIAARHAAKLRHLKDAEQRQADEVLPRSRKNPSAQGDDGPEDAA